MTFRYLLQISGSMVPIVIHLNWQDDCLSRHFRRTKTGNECRSWKEIMPGVPQYSILGPYFFNIHLCDLFFIIEKFDIAIFTDGNLLHVTGDKFLPLLHF